MRRRQGLISRPSPGALLRSARETQSDRPNRQGSATLECRCHGDSRSCRPARGHDDREAVMAQVIVGSGEHPASSQAQRGTLRAPAGHTPPFPNRQADKQARSRQARGPLHGTGGRGRTSRQLAGAGRVHAGVPARGAGAEQAQTQTQPPYASHCLAAQAQY